MGWIASFALLIAGLIVKDPQIMIVAGLYAIAGSIEFLSTTKKEK